MTLSAEDLLRRVVEAQPHLSVPAGDSYLHSYPFLLAHVAALGPLDEGALIAVAHLAYGWMPTVLHLDVAALPGALENVEAARQGVVLTVPQLQRVAAAINHSVVGASKVLHFVNPATYPIWDSRVYRFCHRTLDGLPAAGHFYQVNDATVYVAYAEACRHVVEMPAFAPVYDVIRQQFQPLAAYTGFEVAPLRALEYVMFCAGGPAGG